MAKNMKRILSVTFNREVDTYADSSYLGEYSSKWKNEYTIDRQHQQDCIANRADLAGKLDRIVNFIEQERPICEEHQTWSGDGCEVCLEEKAYTDAMSEVEDLKECDGCAHLDRNSYQYFNGPDENYKGCTPEEIRQYVWQDYKRMEGLNDGDWCYLVVGAEAQVSIPSGQGAVTSTLTSYCGGVESDSKEHIEEILDEQKADLRDQLAKLGFSKRAIATAFKSAVEKEG